MSNQEPSQAALEWEDITIPLEPLNVNGKDGASYGATELALWITERLAHNEGTGDDWEAIPEAIDAYAAAALTQEQRDVLTVWEDCKSLNGPGDSMMIVGVGALGITEWAIHDHEISKRAEWVREQGGEG